MAATASPAMASGGKAGGGVNDAPAPVVVPTPPPR
jgi:hypothetical protein